MKKINGFISIFFACVFVLLSLVSCTAATRDAAGALRGDVNLDGRVTAADARLVLRASVGLEETDLPRMDVNADGKVSAADARLVLRFAVGLETALPAPEENTAQAPQAGAKTLVVYFSRTGHTAPLATYAAQALDADLYEIRAKIPYTDDDIRYYTDCRADREQNDPSARPEIADPLPDLSGYETVLLGYPIWHGQAPKIIYTFLEHTDLTGKTVVPFCTSASSPIGASAENLHPLAPGALWTEGKRFAIGAPEAEIAQWLTELGLIKEEQKEADALQLKINDTLIDVVWEENASVAALAALAKEKTVTVQMSLYGGFEQVGALGESLPRNDEPTTTAPGDIVLYNGNRIVVFYGTNNWSYTPLGKIRGMDPQALTDLLGRSAVTLTITCGAQVPGENE